MKNLNKGVIRFSRVREQRLGTENLGRVERGRL